MADSVLERPAGLTNSRLWFYAVPAFGEALGMVHEIEADHLDGLPGEKKRYSSRNELKSLLEALAGGRWGAHFSPAINAVSFLDAGTAAFLETAGLSLVPAEALIQRFAGLIGSRGAASHERAAARLYEIVETVWDFLRHSHAAGRNLYEGDLRAIMEREFGRFNLVWDHPPLAAAGIHTANPHYDFTGRGALIREGDAIQLDLWAKEAEAESIYADIAWAGIYSAAVPPGAGRVFADLVSVRDETFSFIERGLAAGNGISGSEVDAYARNLLEAAGYGKAVKHRTGHGIDTECHGLGVNLDSVEFPDGRLLLEGSCFSLEPGIYLEHFGFRTEFDVYIADGVPRRYGEPQKSLLHC